MFYLNYKVAFIVLFLTPLSLFITRFIANRSHKYFALQAGQKGKLSSYIDEIQKFIDWCSGKEDKEFTPSDFSDVDISQEDLDALFD